MQIKAAIRHLSDGNIIARKINPAQAVIIDIVIDALRWTIGEPSNFEAMVNDCEAADRAERQ